MKSLVFKEIRECTLVCIGGIIALGAAFALVYFKLQASDLPLVSPFFHAATGFGYAAFGVWLGLTQVMVERRRGRWDFLLHRPISARRIFGVKATVGAALFLVAGAIPLVIAALFATGPFDWAMLLPRLADLFGGLVWYAAGLLVGARQARWIGSRIMPQGLAIVASLSALVLAMNFGEAVLIYAAALAILLPAAAGAFVYGGEYEPQPLFVRFLQGVSIGPGLVLACLMSFALAAGLLGLMFSNESQDWSAANYSVLGDGHIVAYRNGPDANTEFNDINGQPLSAAEVEKFRNEHVPRADLRLQDTNSPQTPRQVRVDILGFQNPEMYVRRLAGGRSTTWFYLVGAQSILGYNSHPWRYIGSIGRDGVAGPSVPPQPLAKPLIGWTQYDQVTCSSSTVYRFDPDKPELKPIYSAPSNDPIIEASGMYEGMRPRDVVVRTRSGIHLVQDGREIFQLPVEHPYPPYLAIVCSVLDDGRYVFQYTDAWFLKDGTLTGDWFVETDPQGHVLSRRQMPTQKLGGREAPWWENLAGTLAEPPILGLWRDRAELSRLQEIANAGVGIAAALVNLLLLSRYESRRGTKIVWGIVGLLMGVSGVLLLLSMRTRVASVRCWKCGKRRLVTDGECPHCQWALAAPAMEGIEILELV